MVVGVLALLGVSSIPVAEYVLFPGSLAAWIYRGDNYASSREFLLYTMAFGVPLALLAGAILGGLLAFVRRAYGGARPVGRRADS